MDFCLVADRLPCAAQRLDLIDSDYRLFARFEAAMLRAKGESEAGPLITGTLDAFLGAGWQAEYTVQEAFAGLLWFYRGGKDAPDEHAAALAKAKPLAFDYIIDGPLIVAAFQAAYGLDLTDPATQIHWWRFQALMQGLPEGCQFSQVVAWRTADLSGMKGEQRKLYAKMQAQFALPPDLGKGEKRVYASKADWDAAFIERLRRQAGRR